MRLVDYNFEDEVKDAIMKYERDKNPSLNGIVEEFVKGILYEYGYLRNDLSEDEIFTLKELNKIDNFSKQYWKNKAGNVRVSLRCGDLNFGSFDENIVDEIIFKLIRLPDEDFIKYSKTYCQNTLRYTSNEYSNFILAWLDDDSMFPEELSLIKRKKFDSKDRIEFFYKNNLICSFNIKKYSSEEIREVELFLERLSVVQIQRIIEMRQKSSMNSDKFILELMKNPTKIEGIMEDV